METAAFVELISAFGFPIAMVIGLAWFIYQIYKKSEDREDILLGEIAATRKVNAEAIATIGKFAENLEAIKHDITDIKEEVNDISEKINK